MRRGFEWIILATLAQVLVVSCASPTASYSPRIELVSYPELNVEVTASVGDNLVDRGSVSTHDGLSVPTEIRIGLLGAYTVNRGTYAKFGESKDYEFFHSTFSTATGSITKSALADAPSYLAIRKSDGVLCVVSIFNDPSCSSSEAYERTSVQSLSSDTFREILVYNGKSGDVINVGYRELSGNLARPAFSNEINYDLSESMEIGYKEVRIRVLEATNTAIKYVVLRNFNGSGI